MESRALRPTGRFAPSPTGDLHLGNLRTALIAWLHARAGGGRFLVRIEDLDRGRVREPYVARQLADLRAIGLDWDEPPVRQSERTVLYEDALERLRSLGLVYRCFCSRREIREAASARHGKQVDGRYPGTCARLSERRSDARAEAGEEFALRLRAEGAQVSAGDARHGPVSGVVDDLVLVRRDRAFAYNLAVVVDDADQGITEVVRGDDLLSSTPDQAHLCDLLGLARPLWAHVPLVLGPSGERLAKRDGPVTLPDLSERGTGAGEAREWILGTLGLAGLEDEALPGAFDPARIPPAPVAFEGLGTLTKS